MKPTALVSAVVLLLLVVSGISRAHKVKTHPRAHDKNPPSTDYSPANFSVLVTNSVTPTPDKNYRTYVVYRGILLGGLTRLQNSNSNFNFTYTEDPNYGPFLESVNGLAGSTAEQTYWQLLVKRVNNQIIVPDVGIGCYIPNANEQIILKYTKY